MDFRDTPDEAAFRAELRAWLAATCPPGWTDASPDRRALDDRDSRGLEQASSTTPATPASPGPRSTAAAALR